MENEACEWKDEMKSKTNLAHGKPFTDVKWNFAVRLILQRADFLLILKV
jgi:hypothetical protein